MPRATIIFGNGLGMALDNEYFRLAAGLQDVWTNSATFTDDHKRLVISAIPGVGEEAYPESEQQLDRLQLAIVASDFLRSFETDEVSWLTDVSRDLPETFRRFVHEVAAYFHESNQELPEAFTDQLTEFIEETKSHVSTLNYDNLLYDAFRRKQVLRGYNGALIDGFQERAGFSPDHLDRNRPNALGWYLHLHGSPLFIGNRKLMRDDRNFLQPTAKSHVVLTHVKHKLSIIDSSPILSEYWRRLNKAFSESARIILFGYSGDDLHLNERIVSGADNHPVHIIEWSGAGGLEERTTYWRTKLPKCTISLHPLDNILDFRDWHRL